MAKKRDPSGSLRRLGDWAIDVVSGGVGAATVEQAALGAVEKLKRSLDSTLGRLDGR